MIFSRKNYNRYLIFLGILFFIFFIIETYGQFRKEESLPKYAGTISKTWVDSHIRISHRRYSEPDTTYFNDFHILLENYSYEFVIGNDLRNQYVTIKSLLQESNYITIRAKKALFNNKERRVCQISSDKRKDIISYEETLAYSKGINFMFLVYSIICFIIPLSRWIKLRSLKSKDFDFNIYRKALKEYQEMPIHDLLKLEESGTLLEEKKVALDNIIHQKNHSG